MKCIIVPKSVNLIIGLLNNTLDKKLYNNLFEIISVSSNDISNKDINQIEHNLINDEFIETNSEFNEKIYSDEIFNDSDSSSDSDSDNDYHYKNNINKYD